MEIVDPALERDREVDEIAPAAALSEQRLPLRPGPPAVEPASAGSFVRIFFAHSPLLDPSGSSVTAAVNGQPLLSLRLDSSNADGSVFEARSAIGAEAAFQSLGPDQSQERRTRAFTLSVGFRC